LTQVHDTTTGKLLARFPVPSEPTLDLFTPDGSTLISATQEGDLRVMGIEPPTELPPIQAHEARIRALAISSDGRQVATSADDRTVRLWELASRELLAEYQVTGQGESLKFSPDDRYLLRVTDDNAVTLLDLAARKDPRRLEGHGSYVYAAAVHPDGELIVTGDWRGTVLLWDASSGREVARLANLGQGIHGFRFSPDGKRLIGIGHAIHVWELATGERIAKLEAESSDRGREAELPAAGTPLDARADRIITGWRPDDATVEVWNHTTGERLRRPLEGLPLEDEAWVSADGRFVVEAWVEPHKPPFLELRRPDGSLHMRLPTTGGRWWPFALDHDARRPRLVAPIKVADSELTQPGSTVGVWDLASKRKLGELRGHSTEVLAVAFTPDDSRIATGSRDGTVRLWDPESFEEIAKFRGHRLYIKDLAFSADGKRLVSTSGDGTAMIWDLVSTHERLQARRQQERELEAARPLVAALVAQATELGDVVERLEGKAHLQEGVRRAARRELRRAALARQVAEVDAEVDDVHRFILERPQK
jgi:WD40 repeat protein